MKRGLKSVLDTAIGANFLQHAFDWHQAKKAGLTAALLNIDKQSEIPD